MPNNRSAEKRERQNLTRRVRNRMVKSKVRSLKKSFLLTVKSKEKAPAEKAFKEMIKVIDTAAGKGVFHKRNAARKKSRLHKLLNKLD